MEEEALDIGELGIQENQETKVDEKLEKEKYIQENIISKGFKLEDFTTSVTAHAGLTLNEISLDTLKKEVDYFKSEQLKEAEKATKLKNLEEINLYSPEHYQLTTHKQLENKLTKLNDENKKINPVIVNSHEEKSGGLLSKKVTFFFNIKCPELNTEVARTIEDFEFFRNILVERYKFKFIPPLFPKKKDKVYTHDLYKRYLNRFLNYISERKILRTSPITLEFLELNSNNFYNYKKQLINQKYICKYNMENYITMKGKLDVEYTKEKTNESDKIYKKLEATSSIYKNLDTALGKIVNDFNKLEKHMKQASDAFSALSNYTKESGQSPSLVTGYEKLKDIFGQWSSSYNKQKFFMEQNFREFFDYINLQVKALEEIQKEHNKIKNDFEKYGVELFAKKEKLFASKKYNLWELSEEDNKNIEELKNNKEKAFKAMIPGMSNLVKILKIQMACSCDIVKKEYDIFMKRQGENVKRYLLSLKDKNQEIISDAYTLCTLFNIEM